jgi:hypothetical protein
MATAKRGGAPAGAGRKSKLTSKQRLHIGAMVYNLR